MIPQWERQQGYNVKVEQMKDASGKKLHLFMLALTAVPEHVHRDIVTTHYQIIIQELR